MQEVLVIAWGPMSYETDWMDLPASPRGHHRRWQGDWEEAEQGKARLSPSPPALQGEAALGPVLLLWELILQIRDKPQLPHPSVYQRINLWGWAFPEKTDHRSVLRVTGWGGEGAWHSVPLTPPLLSPPTHCACQAWPQKNPEWLLTECTSPSTMPLCSLFTPFIPEFQSSVQMLTCPQTSQERQVGGIRYYHLLFYRCKPSSEPRPVSLEASWWIIVHPRDLHLVIISCCCQNNKIIGSLIDSHFLLSLSSSSGVSPAAL